MEPKRSLLDLAGLLVDLEELLGCKVDVVTEDGLRDRIRDRVLLLTASRAVVLDAADPVEVIHHYRGPAKRRSDMIVSQRVMSSAPSYSPHGP